MAPYDTVICDLGNVLFFWAPSSKAQLLLRKVRSSSTWFQYERGRLSQDECFAILSQELSASVVDLHATFNESHNSLVCNTELFDFLKEWKDSSKGRQVFAMTNISRADYENLKARTFNIDWSVFDDIFPSWETGHRKPDLGFYRHVLSKANITPSRTVYIDDSEENVLSAESFGLQGIIYRGAPNDLKRSFLNLMQDQALRGQEFLKRNAGQLHSICEGVVIKENFSQLLILELTRDSSMIDLTAREYDKWNFFQDGQGQLTTINFPSDLDTTSIGLTVTPRKSETVNAIMDEMLKYLNEDGIVQTYFDHTRPRFDPVVCVNVLNLFFLHGRGEQMKETSIWVFDVLKTRAYIRGTRYYKTADAFLFFLFRFIRNCEHAGNTEIQNLSFMPVLKERTRERIGASGDGLALAMRLIICGSLGLRNEMDYQAMLALQEEDGGWDNGVLYKYGSSGFEIGNRGLTTAFAVYAIECYRSAFDASS